MTRTRRLRLIVAVGAALVSAAACASDPPVERTAAEPTRDVSVVRWGFFRNYQPVYVGAERGFFKAEGIDLRLTGAFNSGPSVVQAAGTGQIDAGHSAITGLANAVASGVRVVGVADSQTEFRDSPLQRWYVREDSGIRSITDLRGKTIGTNSLSGSFAYTAKLALAAAGVPAGSVRFVVIPHDRQAQALLSDQIDVAGLIDPYTVEIEKQGQVRRLFTGPDVLGERQISLVFFSRDFVSKHAEATKRFLRAYRRSVDWIAENPEESSRIMAERLGIKSDVVVAHRYTPATEVRTADVQFWIDRMKEFKDLKADAGISATDLVWSGAAGR